MSNVTQTLIIAHSNPPEINDHQPIIKILGQGKGSDPVFPVDVHWSRDDNNMGIFAFYAVMGLIISRGAEEHVEGISLFAVGGPGDSGTVHFLVNLTELRAEHYAGDWNWSAYINVADETAYDYNLGNNIITDDWACILRTGDIYWYDKLDILDITDLFMLIHALGSVPGDADWDWYADLNGDNRVDNSDVAIFYDALGEIHFDVAVLNVATSKDGCIPIPVVGQGYNVTVRVTVENQGDFTETFNVTLYANTTAIETKTVTNLHVDAQTLLNFTWNTASFTKGSYTIKAIADTVFGETDTDDNTKDDGTVLVSIPGDVNGDHLVDISDLVITVNAIPSAPEWPNWNPNADINGDGVCDISDLIICVDNIPSGPW
jgi:hypothetical protein